MTVCNLLTADEFTLAEAACVLLFADPMVALMSVPTRYLDETHEAIGDMVTAIESGELPCVDLPDDMFRRSGDQTGPYVYAATCRKGLFNHEAHARRSRYGVKRADLVAFAQLREYPAPELLKDDPAVLASRLRKFGHANRMAPYDDPVDEAVTRWKDGDGTNHKMMRDELVVKEEYGELDGVTLLRLLNEAANTHGWKHLIFNTPEWRAARPKSPA